MVGGVRSKPTKGSVPAGNRTRGGSMATIHFTTKPLELRTGFSDGEPPVRFIKTIKSPGDADVLRASSLFFSLVMMNDEAFSSSLLSHREEDVSR